MAGKKAKKVVKNIHPAAFKMPLLSMTKLRTQVEENMLDILVNEYQFSNLKSKRRLNKFRAEGMVDEVMKTVVEKWFEPLAG